MEATLFTNFALVIIIAALICALMRLLRQPLMIGYILTGVITGPQILGILKDDPAITIFSQFGIAFLLFLVGIGVNPLVLKQLGKNLAIAGFGQILFTGVVGFGISKALGFSIPSSILLGLGLTLSSTIVVMKLLTDKNDLETLHARISIGILLIQDLVAMVAMLIIGSMADGATLASTTIQVLGIGALLVIVLGVVAVYVLPRIMPRIASSQEFLSLFSVAWLLLVASLFSMARFSLEMGALLAGVALSLSPYRYEMSSKVKPLRDFFILLFFVALGSQLVLGPLSGSVGTIIILSLFVLVGNPLITFLLMCFQGYTSKTAFLAGLTMANISEFSLVLVALGIKGGLTDASVLSLLTTVGLITIAGSTYLVKYGDRLYIALSPMLKHCQRLMQKDDGPMDGSVNPPDVVLFGYNRMGHDLLKALRAITKKVVVVDFNPETIKSLSAKNIACRYGDAADRDLLNDLGLESARLVCSTIPNEETNLLLIRHVRQINKRAIVLAVSHQIDEALRLYKEGASYVFMPHFLGGVYAAKLIEKHGLMPKRFQKEKKGHIKHLKLRKRLGHEQPVIGKRGVWKG